MNDRQESIGKVRRKPGGKLAPTALAAAVGALVFVAGAGSGAQEKAQEKKASHLKEGDCAGILSPVAVMNAAARELRAARVSGGTAQQQIMNKYLALVRPDTNAMPPEPAERLALGDLLFLNYRAVEADAHFDGLLARDDLIGRHAWQRAMQIRRQAFERTDEVRRMLREYKGKFPPTELDIFGRFQQVFNFAASDFKAGKEKVAIALILDEISWLPANAPHQSFRIPVLLSKQVEASGRREEIARVLRKKLNGLRRLKSGWKKQPATAEADLNAKASAPQWYWTFQRVETHQSLRAARMAQLDKLIAELEDWTNR